MIFKIHKGIFMLNHKTQVCFFNNLIGRFYKNHLILVVKTLNLDFILDVIEFPTSIEGFKKAPKVSKIKIPFTQLAQDLQPQNYLDLVQSDAKNLYLQIGQERRYIHGEQTNFSYATSVFQQIGDDEVLQLEALNYALKLQSITNGIQQHTTAIETYIELKPLRYAFSLDTFISETADLDQPFDTREALSGHIVNHWEKWVKANNITSESSYDAVLLNADKLILIRVGIHSFSVKITDLEVADGIIYASLCDLELLQGLLPTFFDGMPCRITAYADMNIQYAVSQYKTWLSSQNLKKIQYVRKQGIEKYLRKKLEDESDLIGNAQLAKTLMNTSYTEQTVSFFSDAWGLSYANHFEKKIRHAFDLVIQALDHEGISLEQLQFINSLTKGAIENAINEMLNKTGSPLNVVPTLTQELLLICDEFNAKKLNISSELLDAITQFTEQYAVSPLLAIKRDSAVYLLYEPLDADNRLIDYEWFSTAVYTKNQFVPEADEQHKTNVADLLKSVEVLHVFKPNILSWTNGKVFETPEEKKNAFMLCLTPEAFENQIEFLRTKYAIPGYFKNLITSLGGLNTVATEQDKYGVFLIESIAKNSTGFAYQGQLFPIDQNAQIDLDQCSNLTLNSKLLPKNYLTFKRLMRLSDSLTNGVK